MRQGAQGPAEILAARWLRPVVTGLKRKEIQQLLDAVMRQARPRIGEGRVADYIPELAKVDLKKLGIAVATVEGESRGREDRVTAKLGRASLAVFNLPLMRHSPRHRYGKGPIMASGPRRIP